MIAGVTDLVTSGCGLVVGLPTLLGRATSLQESQVILHIFWSCESFDKQGNPWPLTMSSQVHVDPTISCLR